MNIVQKFSQFMCNYYHNYSKTKFVKGIYKLDKKLPNIKFLRHA